MKIIVKNWGPVGIWLLLIAIESTGTFSAARTGGWVSAIVTACFGTMDQQRLELINILLRKSGHFMGYAILCLLIFRALHASSKQAWAKLPVIGPACLAVMATFLVACLDEWHQSRLTSRTGTFRDVVLDSAGAIVLQVVVTLMFWKRGRPVPVEAEIIEAETTVYVAAEENT